MSAVVAPSQGAQPSPAAMAICGDRHAAGQSGDADGSTFGAVLDSFDGTDANPPPAGGSANADAATPGAASAPQPPESASPPLSARSISSVHYLASGALVALDKRSKAQDPSGGSADGSDAAGSSTTNIDWASLIAGDKRSDAAPAKTDAKETTSADASALSGIGWAALIQGATAPEPPTKSSAGDGSPPGRILPPAQGASAPIAAPSDPALALSTANVALHGGPAAVDVKVVRSITYLGLDPIVQDAKLNQPTAAKARLVQTTSLETGLVAASSGAEPVSAATGSSDRPASNPGGDSSGHPTGHAGAKGGAAKIDPPANVDGAAAAEANNSAPTLTAARIDSAILPSAGAAPTPIGQLADLIGAAAGSMDAGGQEAAAAVKGAAGAGAANMSPIKELDVQLSPANLGSLSIEMRLSNGNLNITIKADKSDTVKLIDDERGSISDKLKSLNFSVESLTIKASDAASSNGAGGDSNQSGTLDHGQQGQSGRSGEGSPNGRSLQGGDQPRSGRQGGSAAGEPSRDNLPGHRFV